MQFARAAKLGLAAHMVASGLCVYADEQAFPGLAPVVERTRDCSGSEPASPNSTIAEVVFVRDKIKLGAHEGGATGVQFNSDGTLLVSVGNDRRALIWRLNPSSVASSMELLHDEPINAVAFSPGGTRIATAGDHGVQLWDVSATPVRVRVFPSDSGATSVAFSPDGFRLASGSRTGFVRVWRIVGNGEEIAINIGEGVHSVSFNPRRESKMLVAGSEGGTAVLQSVDGASQRTTLRGHKGTVRQVSFDAEGEYVLTVGDNRVRVWRLDGPPDQSLDLYGHNGPVLGGAFGPQTLDLLSPRVRMPERRGLARPPPELPAAVASAGADGIVCVWSWRARRAIGLEHTSGGISGVAFSPDGTRMATAGSNDEVNLWNITGLLFE